MRASSLSFAAAFVVLAACPPAARADEPDPLPGRALTFSIGGAANAAFGHATTRAPLLARLSPELQLGWGIRVGESFLLSTRLGMLGGVVPLFPTGLSAEIVATYLPLAGNAPVRPLVRFSSGGYLFSSGGEALGPDYQAYGFRAALEGGFMRLYPVPGGRAGVGMVGGVQAVGLPGVHPCGPRDDCSDLLIGASLRLETLLLF